MCGIVGNNVFVVSETEGKCDYFASPSGGGQPDHRRFFDEKTYVDDIKRRQVSTLAGKQSLGELSRFDTTRLDSLNVQLNRGSRHNSRQLDPNFGEEMGRSIKKARAGSRHRSLKPDDAVSISPAPPKRGIQIGDSEGLYAFYDQRLRYCQQAACKLIAKVWIKTVEPKKQSQHPYTRGDESRPDWWPKTFLKLGTDVVQDMRHREPDHLSKDERVALLCHILRLVVEPPNQQHEAIRKVKLDISTLEAITFEAMSTWFSDKTTPANMAKKPILKEIFKVARQEEAYKDGGIDARTEVFVQAISDHMGKGLLDDSDDEGQIDTPASSATPSPLMMNRGHPEHMETSPFTGSNMAENLSMRPGHYITSGYGSEPPPDRSPYVEGTMAHHVSNFGHGHTHGQMVTAADMYTNSQASSRRSSMFCSPSEYASPGTPSLVAPWQSVYAYSAQSPSPQFATHMTPGHPSSGSMSGMPVQAGSANHSNMYSTVATHPYPIYQTEGVMEDDIKSEDTHHPQSQ
ncbi:hypothetical protein GGS20DRAFT_207427 [Poronia punctata]|nr:hypothetical protein GGS20DRAFT_207427 [Poronia punctata]